MYVLLIHRMDGWMMDGWMDEVRAYLPSPQSRLKVALPLYCNYILYARWLTGWPNWLVGIRGERAMDRIRRHSTGSAQLHTSCWRDQCYPSARWAWPVTSCHSLPRGNYLGRLDGWVMNAHSAVKNAETEKEKKRKKKQRQDKDKDKKMQIVCKSKTGIRWYVGREVCTILLPSSQPNKTKPDRLPP